MSFKNGLQCENEDSLLCCRNRQGINTRHWNWIGKGEGTTVSCVVKRAGNTGQIITGIRHPLACFSLKD